VHFKFFCCYSAALWKGWGFFFLLQWNLRKKRRRVCFFCFLLLLPLTQLTLAKHNNILCSYVVRLYVVCVFGKCKFKKEEGLMLLISKLRLNLQMA
jgi:hypothetical protein